MNHSTRILCCLFFLGFLLPRLSSAIPVIEFVDNLEGPNGFGEPTALAVSPDGRHLYLTSAEDHTVVLFDTSDPELSPLAYAIEGPDYPEGFCLPREVVVSVDGLNVYVSCSNDAVVVYGRDSDNGQLTFLESHINGLNVSGLDGAAALAVSPDGRHLYAAGSRDDALVAFQRDTTSGRLTWDYTLFGDAFLDLDGVSTLAVSSDGLNLYAAGHGEATVSHFRRDENTGMLTFQRSYFNGFLTPRALALSPDERHLYLTTTVVGLVYQIDNATGELTQSSFFGGEEHLQLAFSPDGRYAYTTNGFFPLVYSRDADSGSLELFNQLTQTHEGLHVMRFPGALGTSPTDGRVFVAGQLLDTLVVLDRPDGSDNLAVTHFRFDGADGPPGLVDAVASRVSSDGRHVYSVSPLLNALVVLSRDPASGRLAHVESYFDGIDGISGLDGVMDVGLSPDGRHLYVISEADPFEPTLSNVLAAFSRDPATGILTFVQAYTPEEMNSIGLERPFELIISPDGAHLYVPSSTSEERIVVLARNVEDGTLTKVSATTEGSRITISPDGRHLYDLFARPYVRDPATGDLVPGLMAAPFDDGGCVYDNVFDGNTCYPESIVISPDGRHVYIGLGDGLLSTGAVMVFERDSSTGDLTFLEFITEGEQVFQDALPEINALAMSPDGRLVYAVNHFDDALVVFKRNSKTGHLAFSEIFFDDEHGVDGLEFIQSVTVSPDSRHLYLTSRREDAIATFKRNCAATDDTTCLNGERFQVEVDWRDFSGNTGSAQVVPGGSNDSGLFWFFAEDNWEMLVKVLDGCGVTDHFWVFAAATTNVEYTLTVTDMETGEQASYFNPLGTAAAAITDTGALATCSAPADSLGLLVDEPDDVNVDETVNLKGSSTLLLNEERFEVEVTWADFNNQTGSGQVVPLRSDDSGLFWFFNGDNWEMLVKVLDGCAVNNRFWVFAAATTNVEYTLKVTDTQSGQTKEYFNPLGTSADSITDTDAFAVCSPLGS